MKVRFVMKHHVRLMALLVLTLLAAGCNRQNSDASDNVTQVTLATTPQGGELSVALTDNSGAPITDATVSLEGNMNHAGMVPVMADGVTDDADGAADGVYHLPFEFTMNGDWIMTISVQLADGSTESHDIELTVTEDGVDIHQDGADAASDPAAMEMSHDEHAAQGVVHVTEGWVRASLPMTDNTALYFTLHNTSDATIRLTGVTVVGLSAELHESIVENGVARMEAHPEGFEIPPGEHLMLEEGGKHVMLLGIEEPLEAGNELEVTLQFDGAEPVIFMAPISAEAGPAMDHSQHGG